MFWENNSVVDGQREYEFVIYSLSDRIFRGQMHQQYKLFCVSKAFVLNQGLRVKKSYSDEKPESIVSNLVGEFLSRKSKE